MRLEARLFEALLPLVARGFVFGSIPKQMKNFFPTGPLFPAIGVARLQQNNIPAPRACSCSIME
jgi:hypothetical protein